MALIPLTITTHRYISGSPPRETPLQDQVCFIINAFLTFLIKHFEKTLQKDIDKKAFKINSTEALQENIYFQDHFSRHNPLPKTHLQTTMSKSTSQADMKGKGKAPAVQPKPKQSRKPYVRISDKHEGVSIETISLQDLLLTEAMYSCSGKSEILQKVLCADLIF